MAYANESGQREHRTRRSALRDHDDLDAEDYYRRPNARNGRHHDAGKNDHTSRRNVYDGSDEDDAPPPRRHRREEEPPSVKEKARADSAIPPPPLGEDRRSVHKNRDDRAGAASGLESEAGADKVATSRKSKSNGKDPHEDAGSARRHKESDLYAKDMPRHTSHKAENEYDETEPRRRSTRGHRNHNPYDDGEPPRRSKSTRSPQNEYDPPRRSKPVRDDYPDYGAPRRSKPSNGYDEVPRRKPSAGDRRHANLDNDDTEPEYERPRPRRAEKPSRYEDGYGTDRPKRQPRDDYDRGYRTDGRDPRRDRDHRQDRREPRDPREPPRRENHYRDDDYYGDHDRKHHPKKKGAHAPDYRGMFEKGKKNWKTVEPVAKPLITTLANAYLKNGKLA